MIGKSFFSLLLLISFSFNSNASEELKNVIRESENLNGISSATSSPSEKSADEDCIKPEDQLLNVSVSDISSSIGEELQKGRVASNRMRTCFAQMEKSVPSNFQESIEFAIDAHLTHERENEFGVISLYQAGTFAKPVSLINTPMCEEVDDYFVGARKEIRREVTTKFGGKQIALEKTFNNLRNAYLMAIKDEKPQEVIQSRLHNLKKFYYSLLASTAQHESLSTADSDTSRNAADEAASFYGMTDYTKAPGVKFYYDKWQSDDHSKRNVGLYQFSASSRGNVSTCIKSWNETFGKKYSSCKLNIKNQSDNEELLKLLGASDQVFNAYCGASKLVQSMGVQINATETDIGKYHRQRTHKNNINNDGSLKRPENRCVSLFSFTSHTYNHFGTLGHTVLLNSQGKLTHTTNVDNVAATNTSKLIDETLGALGLESPN